MGFNVTAQGVVAQTLRIGQIQQDRILGQDHLCRGGFLEADDCGVKHAGNQRQIAANRVECRGVVGADAQLTRDLVEHGQQWREMTGVAAGAAINVKAGQRQRDGILEIGQCAANCG